MIPPESDPPLHPDCLPHLGKGARVLVGLSGGRDSVALLRLLVRRGCDAHACHVHHGIRGSDADADAAFARDLAGSLGCPYHEIRVDVPRLAAAKGLSLETAARNARLDALQACAVRQGRTSVALAHHLGDQAETVLFRLCRGSAGPMGMRAVRQDPGGLKWLRPLLLLTREQLTAWLERHGWGWRDDASNDALDAARNRLRHRVLPALSEAMGRDVRPILARSARLGEETREALDQAIDALRLEDPQGRLYLPPLRALPRALQQAAVHRYLREHGARDLGERAVRSALALLDPNGPARLSLPGGLLLRRKEARLWLQNDSPGEQTHMGSGGRP